MKENVLLSNFFLKEARSLFSIGSKNKPFTGTKVPLQCQAKILDSRF